MHNETLYNYFAEICLVKVLIRYQNETCALYIIIAILPFEEVRLHSPQYHYVNYPLSKIVLINIVMSIIYICQTRLRPVLPI